MDKVRKDAVLPLLSSGYPDRVIFFSTSSCSMQEAQGSPLYVKLDCLGSEAGEVPIDDDHDVPQAV